MTVRGSESDAATAAPVRRRPRDRKAQIVKTAARAFSERGYHPVGIDEIAAELGISGPALYRHFPNKYALLVAAAEYGAELIRNAAESADTDRSRSAEARLDAILCALISATVENRRGGGLYRWERRYLEPVDRKRLLAIFASANAHIADALRQLRPALTPTDTDLLVAATLSVIGSITAHRTALATSKLSDVLDTACWSVLRVDLPAPAASLADPAAIATGLAMSSKRELLINEALRVFSERGYHDAGIEEIGAAAGMNASSVYRYFPSKAELLSSAFYRAADRLAVATGDALASATTARGALLALADRYISLAFSSPELLSVYFAEFGNLPALERNQLRALQRQHIEEWVHLLADTGHGAVETRFRVHAALGLVLDIGRLTHFDPQPETRARVHALMTAVLFG
ncbi:TetR/AcrR family transcriptional regulator [Antrihabitans cavernicola]|uniref:TetR/AcrR family transcriptional regulator n=1 Tax=Antrihabitans cavernicola TaxID=2495913 RepID=A0A5A7S9Q1_9NOCA|nr:TetR/AcrR family transcriptional regulator [Spelaeibacter cavernicola]KAA0021577.1 TetR/AcrR family transcriptional regulator [Spelaeibacter cavernicola]